MGPEARCINDLCSCREGATFLVNRCYARIPLAGKCNLTEECVVGTNILAYCQPGLEACTCVPTAFEMGQSCHTKLFIGGNCSTDLECQLSIEGQSRCDIITTTCQCVIRKHTFLDICSGAGTYFTNMLLFPALVLTSWVYIINY